MNLFRYCYSNKFSFILSFFERFALNHENGMQEVIGKKIQKEGKYDKFEYRGKVIV